ncbi:sterol desaturase family protein [Vasconcelosia minhoensis]|uniref:sterol desaturase family protein n=1 Tax=Vasconcelosia minhoensis TaxID=3366354 RepID=UPI001D140204|nr:sterol desaturase family protein [Romeria gracilis]
MPILETLIFYALVFLTIILAQYFAVAEGTHWLFMQRFATAGGPRGWRLKLPLSPAMSSDIRLSVLSAVIFAFCAAAMLLAYRQGTTRLYTDAYRHGLVYLGTSFVTALLLQDTYFYFTHRLIHRPKLFKWMHRGHHQSTVPTPWTAFAFDPPEALLQGLFLVGLVFLMPLHFSVLAAVALTMTAGAVVHHLGFRVFSQTAFGQWLGKWLIGPSHHLLHHRRYTVHYGLYFTFWDRLLGTENALPSADRSAQP